MSLSTGIVVLYHGGHNPCRIFAEVYDHAQPATREGLLTIEALPVSLRVQDMDVWSGDGVEDGVDVVE
jgi:hypothetical protein